MRGDVDTIKERLDIAEVISGYIKLEKAGASLKARCPFHSEKTPSFLVSPLRQNYYCFGCGAKGDIFTFVEQIEGLEFREALKLLAEKAGVEIDYHQGGKANKDEKDKLLEVLESATTFFENGLGANDEARKYLLSRGLNEKTIKDWRIGYVSEEWSTLYHFLSNLGYTKDLLIKAGLVKISEAGGEPYDVFRGRVIFPLADASGRVIAFSGRTLPNEEIDGPKYLNSPDTTLFTKSEVLYGLDKAKNDIRKKNYAVLVEGQMDLVLSHQVGVTNTVATSGTAFTRTHLERLKRLSSRIITAFDGDEAGVNAGEKSSQLAMALGFEVKVANVPDGSDPAELAMKDPEGWKNILREAKPAIEHFFNKIEKKESDQRKLGKEVVRKILPMITLLTSSIEQSHFITMLSKRTGIKEAVLWEDLKKVKKVEIAGSSESQIQESETAQVSIMSQQEKIKERLEEVKLWQKELPDNSDELELLKKEELELENNLENIMLKNKLGELSIELARAEDSKDSKNVSSITKQIQEVHGEIKKLEENRKVL